MPETDGERIDEISDAAWILALWKYIHGDDSSTQEAAGQAMASLVSHLGGKSSGGVPLETLRERLKPLGITVTVSGGGDSRPKEMDEAAPPKCGAGATLVCLKIAGTNDGQQICICEYPRIGGTKAD
jgi:hypothetical protein